ncbi:hypothetical protein PENDEC_c004G06416 [Penicillium decumbens]|uniref:Uncharacterized protein n=1 Tax=Penicillium decumbens TaxID=69771 RepID=A0A1V6PH54_PENDC|nr:hypothetical protein PENDEC_c004G06416 [Penicillium decumbens]
MSPQDTSGRPEDKPEGLSKYLKRMKTVLRPRSSSKRQSTTTAPNTGQPSTAAAPAIAPAPKPVIEQPAVLADYGIIQREKARSLFAKYGLTLEPDEWKSPTDLQFARVTKPIRMRVRRACHRCDTTFGPDKVCVNCQHPRCKKCPRFPHEHEKDAEQPRIPKPRIPEIRDRQHGAPSLTSHFKLTGDPNAPVKVQSRSGGQDLTQKNVRQRVRRTCHSCGETFASGSKECEGCKHVRCKKCPREPAKLDKYPDGYPGDVDPPDLLKLKFDRTFRMPRRRVHYICHVCNSGYNEGANTCGKCGQAKCAETIRIPPKKIRREPDPEVLRRVEEKIAALNIQE